MRDRLVIAFVMLAVGIIALYGIPRAYMIAELIETSEAQRVVRLADFLSVLVEEREHDHEVSEEFLEPLLRDGERIEYVDADGVTTEVGVVAREDDIATTVDVAGGGTLTFSRSAEVIGSRVADAVQPVIMIGLALTAVSGIAAILLARRLSRPFVQLAETARDLGRGRLDDDSPVLRIPEARAIDEALRASADTLERRIRREHEFAANASHQLRTPITAVRLELEDLSLWPETPPAVRDQLGHAIREIDRLADAIAQLLQMARGDALDAGPAEPLDEIIRGAASRWTPEAHSTGRRITVTSTDAALGSAPAPTSQILDVLLHNALTHGRGDVRVGAFRRAEYVVVQVSDEGPRPSGNSVFERRPEQRSATSGEGIGLAISAELAESLGGHLLLESGETTTFSLMLPARETA
ncbi:putative two-component system histidine kinase [Microbacterium sp. HM58-2]|nr:putative two-component system histidine kinase [Microbacterium sp. HM58-2]